MDTTGILHQDILFPPAYFGTNFTCLLAPNFTCLRKSPFRDSGVPLPHPYQEATRAKPYNSLVS